MRAVLVCFLSVLLMSSFQPLPAQQREGAKGEQREPSEAAAAIAPFLDPHTVAVAQIDLSVETSELFQFAGIEQVPARVQRGLNQLREAGVNRLFAVLSLADPAVSEPFFVVPTAKKPEVCAAAEQFFGVDLNGGVDRSPQAPVCERLENAVFYGPGATLARLKAAPRRASPEQIERLNSALSAVADFSVRIALLLSDEHRRALREMAPQFSPQVGDVRGDDLAAIQWAAVGVATAPEPRLRAIVQTNDAKAAASLREGVVAGLRTLSEMRPVREAIPGIEDLVEALTPEVDGERLIVSVDDQQRFAKLKRAISRPLKQARAAAVRYARMGDLKQFGLGMHNFHDVYASFPPPARYEEDEKVLSWRVYVLPFLGEEELYKQFRLDEPWDSEHNRKLIEKMPAAFAGPYPELRREGKTTIVAPVGEKTIFSGKRGTTIREITDGTSNTILLVSVPPEKAVIWTKPDDLEVKLENPLEGLVGEDDEGFLALFADGSARFISRKIDPETLRRLLMPSDGKVVGEIP